MSDDQKRLDEERRARTRALELQAQSDIFEAIAESVNARGGRRTSGAQVRTDLERFIRSVVDPKHTG
jgi:hypothetical protein